MKMLTKILAVVITTSMCTACAQSQSQPNTIKERVDNFFAENPGKFSGAIEIQENGKTVYQKALGFADKETNVPATKNTKFRIGSISKTFTAVLTFKAVQEGKLSLQDPLVKFFPDAQIPNAEKITVDMLLYHRSGLRDVINDDFATYLTYYTKPQTRAQMIERIAKTGVNFTPDSTFRYCNSGFILLTYILEDATGKSFEQLLNEQIVKPLGLRNTGIGITPIDPKKGFARSFSVTGETLPETDSSVPLGAGAMYSTTSDLLKFFNALTSGYFGKGIYEQMKDFKDNWGRGLFPMTVGDFQGFGHTGGIDGFASVLFKFGDITIALSSNNGSSELNDLIKTILGVEVEKTQSITLSAAQLAKIEGKYFCEKLGLDTEITSNGTQIFGQATGQPAFPLYPTADNTIENKDAGIVMVFDFDNHKFTLKQSGMEYEFVKSSTETTENTKTTDSQPINIEQFEKYTGSYHSDALNMDIRVFIENNKLMAQGSGQSSFPLSPTAEDVFEFQMGGIKMTFNVNDKKMKLKQHGMEFEFGKK